MGARHFTEVEQRRQYRRQTRNTLGASLSAAQATPFSCVHTGLFVPGNFFEERKGRGIGCVLPIPSRAVPAMGSVAVPHDPPARPRSGSALAKQAHPPKCTCERPHNLGYTACQRGPRPQTPGMGTNLRPMRFLISVTVFLMLDVILDLADSPSPRSFPPRPTMQLRHPMRVRKCSRWCASCQSMALPGRERSAGLAVPPSPEADVRKIRCAKL